jgi:excisionase family DNA binding protein
VIFKHQSFYVARLQLLAPALGLNRIYSTLNRLSILDLKIVECYNTVMSTQENTESVLITYREAAQLLSVSEETIRRMVSRSKLSSVYLSKRMPRIVRQDVIDFIRANTVTKGAEAK